MCRSGQEGRPHRGWRSLHLPLGASRRTCEARCPLVHLNGERPGCSHGVPVGVSRVQLLRFHWREPTLLSDAASQEPSATARPHLLSGV